MKILDNHVHTHFSIDAKDTMEDVIKRAIDIGVDYLTFTDHLEYNTDHFSLDIPQYISKIAEYKDKYKKDIELLTGIEVGYQSHLNKEINELLNLSQFDFILCSTHTIEKIPVSYKEYFEGFSKEEAYRKYFNSIIQTNKEFSNYDVYGHLDYINRYAIYEDNKILYNDYRDVLDEVEIMLKLLKEVNENNDDINLTEVDLGGGIGVYYTEEDKPKTISEFCEAIINKADEVCEELNIKRPTLLIEPGRSLVANAGSTIYTVGSIKEIKNVRTYVSVDGGMTDNIRPSLYQADYECGIVNKINKTGHNHKVTIAGKCCESGDILISDTEIGDINSGDILITTTTGAYGYSMASNYNKIPKNPVVFVQNGEDKLACKRQSYEDLLALEV